MAKIHSSFTLAIVVAVVFLCIGFCVYPLHVLIASHQYSPFFIGEYFSSSPLCCLVLTLTQPVNMPKRAFFQWVRARFLGIKLGPLARVNLTKKRFNA